MATIFDLLPVYAGKWSEKSSRNFTQEEIAAVDTAVVVSSAYGASVCFMMKSGGQTYIPLSSKSTASVGEVLDLSKAKVITLAKSGESDIIRVEV
jgi:hypothetical protein